MKPSSRKRLRLRRHFRPLSQQALSAFSPQGFTLIELLVASFLTSVVILVAWSGLISVMNMSQVAEARSARQTELNRALDFMTNEIRMARSINASSTLTANGSTITLNDVVTSAGVNLANLGSYGTLGLYLERPISNIPAICPIGGPNAGSPPPAPADFDPIVYDIRPSPSGWLQPRMVARYGRTPEADGTINPCTNPVASDPMIDALSTMMKSTPTCSGVRSGSGGFYSCAEGREVKLFFQSDVAKAEVRQVNSTVASRIMTINPTPVSPTPSGTCDAINVNSSSAIGNRINLTWSCSNSPTGVSYEVHRTLNGTKTIVYSGSNNSFSYTHTPINPGDNVCLAIESVTNPRRDSGSVACLTF